MSSEMTATQKALFDVLNECYDLPYDRFEEIFLDLEKLVAPVAPAAGLVNAQEAWEAAEEGSEWVFRSIGGHTTVRTKGSFSPYWNETVSIERHVVEGLPVAPTTSTMLWAVRDTTSGAIYPQPNKLIAEQVAEVHGHCEIIEVMVSSPTSQSQDHMHELVQHRDGKPPWCNVCLRTADGRLARDIPFGER